MKDGQGTISKYGLKDLGSFALEQVFSSTVCFPLQILVGAVLRFSGSSHGDVLWTKERIICVMRLYVLAFFEIKVSSEREPTEAWFCPWYRCV
jgi:hypothetical protein